MVRKASAEVPIQGGPKEEVGAASAHPAVWTQHASLHGVGNGTGPCIPAVRSGLFGRQVRAVGCVAHRSVLQVGKIARLISWQRVEHFATRTAAYRSNPFEGRLHLCLLQLRIGDDVIDGGATPPLEGLTNKAVYA